MNEKIIIKKRGRPRKNISTRKIEKEIIINDDKKIEEEIILHLKICSDDEKLNDNNFFSINNTTENSNDQTNFVTKLDSSNDSDFDPNNLKIEDLYNELKQKEHLIKQLNYKINQLNLYGPNKQNISNKEIIKKYHNLNLLTINGKKLEIKPNTNIKCWNCTHNFDNIPCFIPDKYINNSFYVFGCFCSYNCAATYNLHYLNDSRIKTRYALIQILFSKIFGNNKRLTYASKKEVLTDYGGCITIDEYRKSFLFINKEYKINIPPMIPLLHELDVIDCDISCDK